MASSLLCIAGKSQAAVDVLRGAQSLSGIRIVCLPNANDGGVDGWQPSLLKAAREAGVETVTLDCAMRRPELCFMSVEYDSIVRPERFATTALFNIHFSLLPKYRGCNTAVWPILEGEENHGVTLHEIDAGVDTGAIIDQRAFPIGDMTARDLYFRCMALGSELVLEWLPRLLAGDYRATPQSEEGASCYRRKDLDFSRKEIDLAQSTAAVLRQVRAFTFPEYQRPTYKGVDILEARPAESPEREEDRGRASIVVPTLDGALRLYLAP
jgi:methionyl-tRNA formyltransferase